MLAVLEAVIIASTHCIYICGWMARLSWPIRALTCLETRLCL